MGKEGRLRKYKGSVRKIRWENEYRSKKTRKIRYGRGERLQEKRVTKKVYGKDAIQIG